MASLNLPSITTSRSKSYSNRPFFAKPSHFIIHAKRNNKYQVSCSSDENETNKKQISESRNSETGKLDRRNMLLGFGGLYGAANLISSRGASAAPIDTPPPSTCTYSSYDYEWNPNEPQPVWCCPPAISGEPVDFKFPIGGNLRTRPAAHTVNQDYITKYNRAIQAMKDLPGDHPHSFMQQANIHCAYCNGGYKQSPNDGSLVLQVHDSWLFFPFHRWYLYFYERILGKLIGDPTFALPFWNWDNPEGMTMPSIFRDCHSAIYDPRRNQDNLLALVDLGFSGATDPCQLVDNNLAVMYNEMIGSVSSVYDFMGQAYSIGTVSDQTNGPGSVERGSHTSIHQFCGDPRETSSEDMGNFYSAGRDPIFYSHHSNVDRMWRIWQQSNPTETIANGDFLNASFLFYDENLQLVRVKVQDALDSTLLGYDYAPMDTPWANYVPPTQPANAAAKTARTTFPRAETLFPLKLESIVKFQVQKTKKGKADELLVIENIEADTTKFIKFDVFVDDEDDDVTLLNKASYAGTYAHVPQKTEHKLKTTSIRLKLTDLYEKMDVEDDETVVVTLVPRHEGPGVTIGGIKIIENPGKTALLQSS